MHEEDFGIAWKHTDFRTGDVEVRRSRRLVVSSIATVGNYEYGFFWYLYTDGTIEYEIKLTGVLTTGAFAEGEMPRHGQAGRAGPLRAEPPALLQRPPGHGASTATATASTRSTRSPSPTRRTTRITTPGSPATR